MAGSSPWIAEGSLRHPPLESSQPKKDLCHDNVKGWVNGIARPGSHGRGGKNIGMAVMARWRVQFPLFSFKNSLTPRPKPAKFIPVNPITQFKMTIKTVSYINASELHDPTVEPENAWPNFIPASWGDNSITLVDLQQVREAISDANQGDMLMHILDEAHARGVRYVNLED